MLPRPTTALRVRDLVASLEFYRNGLGFPLLGQPGADLAVVDGHGYPVLLAGPGAGKLEPHLGHPGEVVGPGATVYFFADDLGATEARLVGRGLPGVRLTETNWGEPSLSLPDPDGYTVRFWTRVERSPEDVLALYARGPAALEAALAGLDHAALDLARAPGKWTVRQIVHHLADAEAMALARIKVALAEPGGQYAAHPSNLQAWATALDYAGRPVEPAIALFAAIRAAVLESLQHWPDALERTTRSGDGPPWSVGRLVEMLAIHAMTHVDQILETRRVHEHCL